MKYRSEIDGLRAIAVIPVILFHAGFNVVSGGFLGVDVFFVISGYLISSIILAEKEAGTFSLINFYERRARRILPALYFMISIASILACFFMLPAQLKEFGQSLISTTLFSANIFFWLKTDYWAQSAELTPLLHIWSLGVEEQFYLLFPLLLIFIKTNKLKLILFITLIVSFFGMLYVRGTGNISEAFYLLPFRAWELIAGAMAVFWKIEFSIHTKKIIGLFALVTLISSYLIFDEHTNPIVLYSIPIISTFLIVAFPVTGGVASYILKSRYLVYIGTISYSLYLFHQPIFALLRLATFGTLNLSMNIACLITTFIFAVISYKFVETPFRDRATFSKKSIIILSVLLIISFLLLGLIFHFTDGLRNYKLSKMRPETKILFTKFESTRKERLDLWDKIIRNSRFNFGSTSKIKILFVGDSLSQDLLVASALSENITEKTELRQFDFDDECVKYLKTNGNEIGNDSMPCEKSKDVFLNSPLLKDSEVVVIAEAWLSNAKYFDELLKLPQLQHKKIIVYLTHSFTDMTSLLLYIEKSESNPNSSEFKKFVYLNRHQRTMNANSVLEDLATKYNLSTINAYNFFCDSTKKECTVIDELDFPMIIDQTHLSGHGVIKFSPWFASQLKKHLPL